MSKLPYSDKYLFDKKFECSDCVYHLDKDPTDSCKSVCTYYQTQFNNTYYSCTYVRRHYCGPEGQFFIKK